ncbi:MAG TPA: OmpA family protein [Pseudomonadales bacterium]|nr:OmpA family protein [Pseudomonadales bacterium]
MKKLIGSVLAVSVLTVAGCAGMDADGTTDKTAKGAGIGAAGGAVLGAMLDKHHRAQGALLGAAIGGVAGGAYGHRMDKQEAELKQQMQGSGVDVQRNGDSLNIILPGNITFATNQSTIQPSFQSTLNQLASSLVKYPDSTIQITGYTDSTGNLAYNNQLSEQRAMAVSMYLTRAGVASNRIQSTGAGPSNPVADNSTPDGRAQNRRVEIQVIPTNQQQ